MDLEKLKKEIIENGNQVKMCDTDDEYIDGIYSANLIEATIKMKDGTVMYVLCPDEDITINILNSSFAIDSTIISAPLMKSIEDIIEDVELKWR